MASAASEAFGLSYQISPVILTGGIASSIPGGMLPIVSITNALSFSTGLLSGSDEDDLDQYLAQFHPEPGASLIEQVIGEYPFANQSVAANAVIAQPLNLSMRMDISAKPGIGYQTKFAAMTALQSTLASHNNAGGLYTVCTPSFIYTNMVMLSLRDISRRDIRQPQNAWEWVFRKPLVTLSDAAAAQNSLMSKITAGAPTDGSLSGVPTTVGSPPTLATPSVAPAASNLTGGATASPAQADIGAPILSSSGFNQ